MKSFVCLAFAVLVSSSAIAERIAFETEGGAEIRAVHALPPEPGTHPSVVLLAGCNSNVAAAAAWTDRLVAAGYGVLALGPGIGCERDSDVERWHAARAARSWLAQRSGSSNGAVAVVGLGEAGAAALAASTTPLFDASVGVHSPIPDRLDNAAPVLLVQGREARRGSPGQARALSEAATAAGRIVETRIYPAASDEFDVRRLAARAPSAAGHRYDAHATARARRDVVDFLDRHLARAVVAER